MAHRVDIGLFIDEVLDSILELPEDLLEVLKLRMRQADAGRKDSLHERLSQGSDED